MNLTIAPTIPGKGEGPNKRGSVNEPINELVDDAYQAKYKGSPYLSPMIGARTRSATVKVMPRKER